MSISVPPATIARGTKLQHNGRLSLLIVVTGAGLYFKRGRHSRTISNHDTDTSARVVVGTLSNGGRVLVALRC